MTITHPSRAKSQFEIIQLISKTLKGKNRIHQHGAFWKLIREDRESLLIESVKTGDWRWILKADDPNFTIRKIDD